MFTNAFPDFAEADPWALRPGCGNLVMVDGRVVGDEGHSQLAGVELDGSLEVLDLYVYGTDACYQFLTDRKNDFRRLSSAHNL